MDDGHSRRNCQRGGRHAAARAGPKVVANVRDFCLCMLQCICYVLMVLGHFQYPMTLQNIPRHPKTRLGPLWASMYRDQCWYLLVPVWCLTVGRLYMYDPHTNIDVPVLITGTTPS